LGRTNKGSNWLRVRPTMLVSNSGVDRNARRCGTNGCNRLLATVLASQLRGHVMNFFVEAKHPHGGGMVLVLCRTRGDALQAIANLKKEGYADVKGTNSSGSVVEEGDDLSEHR
jgi:ribosomal protein L2